MVKSLIFKREHFTCYVSSSDIFQHGKEPAQ